MVRGQLTFISGGVRSGKSAYAERLLVRESRGNDGRLVYIATGRQTDAEMVERIDKHQLDRSELNWKTFEQPVNMEKLLPFIENGDLVLWDCVTTWLANELYDGADIGKPCIEKPNCMENKERKLYVTIDVLLSKVRHLVIVSNEVLDELASPYDEVRIYSEWLGRIHQKLVEKADTAIEMEYGLAKTWKGEDAN